MEVDRVQTKIRSVVAAEYDDDDDEEEDENLPFIRIRPLRELVRNPALFCPQEFQEEEEDEESYENIIFSFDHIQRQEQQQDEDTCGKTLQNSLDLDKSGGVDTQEFNEDVAKMVQETFSVLDLGNAEVIHSQDDYDEEFSMWLDNLLEPKYPGLVLDNTIQDQELPTDQNGLRNESNDADATSSWDASVGEISLNGQGAGDDPCGSKTVDACERHDNEVELSQLINLANSNYGQRTEEQGASNSEPSGPVANASNPEPSGPVANASNPAPSVTNSVSCVKTKTPPRAGPASWKVRLMKKIREAEERAEAAKRLKEQTEHDDEKQAAKTKKSGKKLKVKKVELEFKGPKIRTKGDGSCKKNDAVKVRSDPVDRGKSPRPSKKLKTSPEVAVEKARNDDAVSQKIIADNKQESEPKNILTPTEAPPREESSDESDVPLAILRKKMLKAKKVRKDSEETSHNEEELGLIDGSFDLEKPQLNKKKKYWSSKIQADAVAIWEAMQKPTRDMGRLTKLMKRTFPYRQHQYNDADDLELILRNFPALQDYRLLKYDMKLLRNIDLKALDAKWTHQLALKYQAKVAENFSASDPVISGALEQLKRHSSNKELRRDVQLLCVGNQETDGKLYKNLYAQRLKKSQEPFKSAANTPSIDILGTLGCKDTEISIYCESKFVTKTPNLYEAVMSAYSLYWLLNLKYESNCIRFFELLDSVVV